ncbi:AP2 domain-containing protein [Lysinibacillus odysseyi]|uniref:AP2 domain-containing protein n=1 Tax=Lysinibacillus odysseyi TaxID=202611 RepID=UPI000690A7C0|nr:AP2 domain-containing protein [Lysinibacillus odysseyi]
MSRQSEVFTCNRLLGVEATLRSINEFCEGKKVIGIDAHDTLTKTTFTVVVEEVGEGAILPQAIPGKGYGSSRYRGVHWDKKANKWRAMLSHKGKRYTVGRYHDEISAAKAYDAKALEIVGPDAYLNFPLEVTK